MKFNLNAVYHARFHFHYDTIADKLSRVYYNAFIPYLLNLHFGFHGRMCAAIRQECQTVNARTIQ